MASTSPIRVSSCADSATPLPPPERTPADVLERQIGTFAKGILTQALNAVSEIVLVLNAQRAIIFANEMADAVFGAGSMVDGLGKLPGDLLKCENALNSEHGCGTTRACTQCGALRAILGSLGGKRTESECRVTRLEGGRYMALDLRVKGTPVDLEGERFSIFAIQDISHEKRRRTLERIFFHDILNTAGGAANLAKLLAETAPAHLSPEACLLRETVDSLVDEILSQRELLEAENEELSVRPTWLESRALCKRLSETLTPKATGEALSSRIVCEADSESICFESDYTLLRRVLGNMVKNALEAVRPGETVTLSCGPGRRTCKGGECEAGVRFSVHNPGLIPYGDQLQIFQRSFSTKGEDRGLGTYSIKLLTEHYLGGEVGFSSTSSGGTTFYIILPLTRSGAAGSGSCSA